VLLIAFTGEEIGAAGSKHFAEHPTVPLDRVTAMLNLDTVGRMKGGRVDLYGVKSGVEFRDIMMNVGRQLHVDVVDEPERGHAPATSSSSAGAASVTRIYLRGALGIAYYTPFYSQMGGSRTSKLSVSDEVPFFWKEIPAIFFSTGKPGHLPDDTVEHLNIEGIQRVTTIAYALTDELLRRPKRITFEGRIPGEY
jgi:Zn-dependent M28 family amino/carboxypeptidase